MHRSIPVLFLLLAGLLMGCGGDGDKDDPSNNGSVNNQEDEGLPEMVCFQVSDNIAQRPGYLDDCDFQAGTGCQEGYVCGYGDNEQGEASNGLCTLPCESNADCGGDDGDCSSAGAAGWGRCPGGTRCWHDKHCPEWLEDCLPRREQGLPCEEIHLGDYCR
jgi:hypothetical protein